MKRRRRNPETVALGDPLSGTSRWLVQAVDADGHFLEGVGCHTLEQCRQVARVDSQVYGPYTIFRITDWGPAGREARRGRLVERWAVGKTGTLKRLGSS